MIRKPFSTLCAVVCAVSALLLNGCGEASKKEYTPLTEWRDTVLNDKFGLLIEGRFIEHDTLFFTQEFEKEKGKLVRKAIIYLETDKESPYYQPASWTERFDEKVAEQMKTWMRWREIEGMPPLRKVDLFSLPTDWIPLHYLDGRPYVYSSHDTDVPVHRLTDSLLLRHHDFQYFPLKSGEKLSSRLYHFELAEDDYSDLYIHIMNKRTGEAVWEYLGVSGSRYELMIPVSSVKRFDLIVCDHPYRTNFDGPRFDDVDVKSLLYGKKAASNKGRKDSVRCDCGLEGEQISRYVERNGDSTFVTLYMDRDSDSSRYRYFFWDSYFGGKDIRRDLDRWLAERQRMGWPLTNKVDLLDLPNDWLPLRYWCERPCVLSSSRYDLLPKFRLTYSLLMQCGQRNYFYPLRKCEKLSPTDYLVELEGSVYDKLLIHFIDETTRAAVWEFVGDGVKRFSLMVPTTSVKMFDVAVCEGNASPVTVGEIRHLTVPNAGGLLDSIRNGREVDIYDLNKLYRCR